MNVDALPKSAALERSDVARPWGGLPHKRLTVREGSIVSVDPETRLARVLLADGNQGVIDGAPILGPASPDMPPGTNVLIGYSRGEPHNPLIIARIDYGEDGATIHTKRPYVDDVDDVTNLLVQEIVHTVAEPSEDWRTWYPDLVSWLRSTTAGEITFVHNQTMPNPRDGDSADYSQHGLKAKITPDDELELSWLYGAAKTRAVRLSTDDAGDMSLAVETQEGSSTTTILTLTVGEDSVQVAANGATFQIDSDGNLTIQTPKLTVDSPEILLGNGGRRVAYQNGRIKPHSHKFYVGHNLGTTGSTIATIYDGEGGVRV